MTRHPATPSPARRRAEDVASPDAGFTLVEVVVALVLVMLIMGPIVAAIIVGLNTTGAASTRLSQSDDRQLLEIWLPRDVAGTQHLLPGTTTPGATANVALSASNCAVTQGAQPAGTTAALVLQGNGVTVTTNNGLTSTSTYLYEADYVLVSSGSSKRLVRYYCNPSTSTSMSMIVAYGLTSATGTAPASPTAPATISLAVTDTAGNTATIQGLERS
ncbi:MAG TPA: hypothetical protein VE991_02000 [Acidimicrobiales bacterium]|nr:hypothetical protein [Acidimicrobiales bacterium]